MNSANQNKKVKEGLLSHINNRISVRKLYQDKGIAMLDKAQNIRNPQTAIDASDFLNQIDLIYKYNQLFYNSNDIINKPQANIQSQANIQQQLNPVQKSQQCEKIIQDLQKKQEAITIQLSNTQQLNSQEPSLVQQIGFQSQGQIKKQFKLISGSYQQNYPKICLQNDEIRCSVDTINSKCLSLE
ncbi:hypothetical protein ABPG73_022776, partial [Tetrahymena malaccensis]